MIDGTVVYPQMFYCRENGGIGKAAVKGVIYTQEKAYLEVDEGAVVKGNSILQCRMIL